MIERYRHLLRQTAIYGVGGILQRFVGFLLIPLYTRFLGPSDYGVLALAGLLYTAFQQLQLLGFPSAITRSYILVSRTEGERESVVATGAWVLLLQALVLGAGLALFAVPVAWLVFGNRGAAPFVWLVAASAPAYAIETLRNTLFRVREQAKSFVVVTLTGFLLNLGLTLFFVVGMRWGAFGVILGQVASSIIMACLFLPWLLRAIRPSFRLPVLGDMLGYALPLVPAGFATWTLDLLDRYLLRLYRPMEEVGLYSLGYRFGMLLVLILMAFRTAWPQVVFTQAAGEETVAKRFFSHALTYYAVGIGFVALAVATLSGDALRLMTPPEFHAAAGVIPLIALAYAVQGSFIILEVGIDVKKRTGFIPLFTGLAALLNVLLNMALIPRFGMYGAAWATLISFLVIPTGYFAVNQRIYPIRFEWRRIGVAAVLAGALFAATLALDTGRPALNVLLRAGVVVCYPLLLWWLPFPLPEERAHVTLWLRRARGGAGA